MAERHPWRELKTRAVGRAAPSPMAAIQRARILAAMADVVAKRGLAAASVGAVVRRAGVSRRTFYEQFSDRDECFSAAFDDAIDRIAARVLPAYEQPGSWRERIRAALIELLSFLDDDPGTGRLVIVQTLGAGRLALERRGRVLAQLIAAVDAGRGESKGAEAATPLTAEGVVRAGISVVHARIAVGDPRPLLALANQLMSMIVLPYLGPAAARRELDLPVPRSSPRRLPEPLTPIDLPIRVTHRTVLVLEAIATQPGASNRQVGDLAGIHDQGQISKLLHRLRERGMIDNAGDRHAGGVSNAWRLTERGRQALAALGIRPDERSRPRPPAPS